MNRIEVAGDKSLVIGDFNDIVHGSEKEYGDYRSVVNTRDFNEFIMNCGLLDLGYVGYLYTWRN